MAKLLGLGYPGGPEIDRLAAQGDDRAVPFPRTRLTHADRNAPHLPGTRDFSFSGLKTSVLRHVTLRRAALGLAASDPLPAREVIDICASFQRVIVESLVDGLFDAARWYGARSVGIAGGVSANGRLRAESVARGRTAQPAGVHSEPGAVDRQRRDDCRRGAPRAPPRRDGGVRTHGRGVAATVMQNAEFRMQTGCEALRRAVSPSAGVICILHFAFCIT